MPRELPSSIMNAIAERENSADWYSARESARQHVETIQKDERKRNRRVWFERQYKYYTDGILA